MNVPFLKRGILFCALVDKIRKYEYNEVYDVYNISKRRSSQSSFFAAWCREFCNGGSRANAVKVKCGCQFRAGTDFLSIALRIVCVKDV